MLKTPKNYDFAKITDSLNRENYKLSPTDAVQMRLFSNDGFKLIDISGSGTTNLSGNNVGAYIEETIDKDGLLKLPLLGKVKISGLTLREAQDFLEKEYDLYYKKPFIQLKITNKRVIVFPGNAGSAKVVPISNNNMTVFEALAYAGGITEDGKAYRIKLIRNTNQKPLVYLIDLSKIDGISQGNITVLANDIIYVEPRPRFVQRAISEITPYLSIITTSLALFYIIKK